MVEHGTALLARPHQLELGRRLDNDEACISVVQSCAMKSGKLRANIEDELKTINLAEFFGRKLLNIVKADIPTWAKRLNLLFAIRLDPSTRTGDTPCDADYRLKIPDTCHEPNQLGLRGWGEMKRKRLHAA